MIGVRPALAPFTEGNMDQDKLQQFAEALSIISQSQMAIMHSMSYLACEHENDVPSIGRAVDTFAEWLQSMHAVMVEAEPNIPRVIVEVPPLRLDVL